MTFIPNWEPEVDNSKISRRNFLEWWFKLWAWLWVAWLVWWVLSWNKEAFASLPNYSNVEKFPSDLSWKMENWDSEWFEESLKKFPSENRQVILDSVLTWIFFWKIIPKFLSWEIPDAMAITIPAVSLWYSLSSPEAQHHFMSEMWEAWFSVVQMMAIVSATEWVSVNIERLIQSKISEKFDVEISEFSSNKSNVWKKLARLWISLISSEDENDEETRNVYCENWRVFISKEVFLEILPYIISWKNFEWILSKISYYSTKKDFKEVKAIIDENIGRNWFWEFEESEPQKQEELKFLAKVFMHEISLLVSFVLTNQLIFWLWQTTLIKDKIAELWLKLELLALNSWFSWLESRKLSKNFVNLSISYLPNRMAWTSDLWPFMAALSKWWWAWVLKMIDWVLPTVLANVLPYLRWVEDILQVSLWFNTQIWSWFLETFRSDLPSNVSLFWRLILQSWKTVLDTVWAIWERVTWLDFSIPGENLWVKKRNLPFVLNSKKLQQILSNPFSNTEIKDEDMSQALEECEYFLSQDADISSDYLNSKFWIKNILGLIFTLEQIYERWTKEHKDKINEIFRNHITKFRKLAENISELKSHSRDGFLLANSERLLNFVSIFIDFDEKKHSSLDVQTVFFQEVYDYISDSWNWISWVDFSDNWLYVEDLELCFKENIYKYWSLKSMSKMISNNLEFLMFVKWKNSDLYEKLKNIFITNILNIENSTKESKWLSINSSRISWALVYLVKPFINDEISAFLQEEILSDTRLANLKNSYEEILRAIEYWPISEDNQKNEDDWNWRNIIFSSFSDVLWKAIHSAEHFVWKNSFEVLQMIFMIQTPYVLAVKDTIARIIKQLPENAPSSLKEYFIWLGTYVISMFADNYVWLVVWVELARDLLWMDSMTAIEKFSKHAIYWGSKVVTWNSPNALFDSKLTDDFYFQENFSPSNDNEIFNFYSKIDSKMSALQNSKSKKWFNERKSKLRRFIIENDFNFWRWFVSDILNELDKLDFLNISGVNNLRQKMLNAILSKMTLKSDNSVFSQLSKLWLNISEVMVDVASLQLTPSLSSSNSNFQDLALSVWWISSQSVWAWKVVNWAKRAIWKLVA